MSDATEKRWCVVGGVDKGGILVRTGQETSSPEAASRLATGALVKQEELVGDRLSYTKLTGEGPETGWVSIKLKDKILVETAPVFEPKEAEEGRQAGGVFAERPPPAEASRKIRLLCLHGTASSEKVFKSQLAALIKQAGDKFEFVFVEGCIVCDPSNPIVGKQLEIMKKFFPNETFKQWGEPLGEQLGWRRYDGLDVACKAVQEALQKEAPIDAVLGFSQGSNVAHLVAAQAGVGKGAPLRCVVHICTSKPGWVAQMPELFEYKIPVPALCISADQDTVATGNKELASSYEAPELASHSGEHRPMPAKAPENKELADTIVAFLEKHCRE
mmetsp:Transcript_58717/g.157299  ORF Transcript_58717/g.157299 Transcript_58717/m.157299 type:complete len:330 (-) Transcript_58717:169-1158(-)